MTKGLEFVLELDDKLQRSNDQRVKESMKRNHIIPAWLALQHVKGRGSLTGEEAQHVLTVAQREGYLEPLSSTECKNALGADWRPSNGSYLRILVDRHVELVMVPIPLASPVMPAPLATGGIAPAGTPVVSWRPFADDPNKLAGFDAHNRFIEGEIRVLAPEVPAAPQNAAA